MTSFVAILLSTLLFVSVHARGQDGAPPAFQPAPPVADPSADFDDMEDDLMEMGDDGFRPPPPPPPPGSASSGGTQSPPTPGFDRGGGSAPASGGNFGGASAREKLKFKIVDGEYWEKGKKRSRGKRLSSK